MNKNRHIYINLHYLKNMPNCCCNRNDDGRPKSSYFGGSVRSMISSQSVKHAMREYFKKNLRPEEIGTRTKRVAEMISEKIAAITGTADLKLAETALGNAGLTSKNGQTDALFFVSEAQTEAIAQLAVKGEKNKKMYLNAIAENPSADIYLFGRMSASVPSLDVEAAVNVAKAFSTHTSLIESEFYTAIDERQGNSSHGAAMLGTMDYYSACFYFYVTLDLTVLAEELKEDTCRIVEEFMKAALYSNPRGGISNSAHYIRPDFVYAALSEEPANFASAFECPVYSNSEGFMKPSIEAFCDYADYAYGNMYELPEKSYLFSPGYFAETIGNAQKTTLLELPKQLGSDADAYFHGEDFT